METQGNTSSSNGKKGGTKVVIAIGVVVIIALVAVIIYLLWPKNKEEEKRNVVVTPDNIEEVLQDMATEKTSAGYYTVTQNSTWNFPDSKSPSTNAYVENAVNNTNDVYFDVFINGEENDENNALIKSPIIPVGSSLKEISLEKELDAGTYDCVLIYHLVDEDQNSIDTLRVSVTLVIES